MTNTILNEKKLVIIQRPHQRESRVLVYDGGEKEAFNFVENYEIEDLSEKLGLLQKIVDGNISDEEIAKNDLYYQADEIKIALENDGKVVRFSLSGNDFFYQEGTFSKRDAVHETFGDDLSSCSFYEQEENESDINFAKRIFNEQGNVHNAASFEKIKKALYID